MTTITMKMKSEAVPKIIYILYDQKNSFDTTKRKILPH
jgi:hypothetical protein